MSCMDKSHVHMLDYMSATVCNRNGNVMHALHVRTRTRQADGEL